MKRIETQQERRFRQRDRFWELVVFLAPMLLLPIPMYLIYRFVYNGQTQASLFMGTILLFFGWMAIGCTLRVKSLDKEIARMKRENEENEH